MACDFSKSQSSKSGPELKFSYTGSSPPRPLYLRLLPALTRSPDLSAAQRDFHCVRQIQVKKVWPHSELQIPIRTAGSRSDWALPDLNRELQIPMGTAGSQPRLPDRSRHYRTTTATSRSQWALLDLNSKNIRKDMKQKNYQNITNCLSKYHKKLKNYFEINFAPQQYVFFIFQLPIITRNIFRIIRTYIFLGDHNFQK